MKPRLLDLFCGQGGAGAGYAQAGFDVTGVDIAPQPRYPFRFVQGDALAYVAEHGHEYDAIHASPPCQAHSQLEAVWRDRSDYNARHIDLIPQTRALLMASGKPYVIENVPGAPLIDPITLCGRMFGLRVIRHRLFEPSVYMLRPQHGKHDMPAPRTSRRPADNEVYSWYGHFSGVAEVGQHVGIEWMNQHGMAQAIPPAYTRWIGEQLLDVL